MLAGNVFRSGTQAMLKTDSKQIAAWVVWIVEGNVFQSRIQVMLKNGS